MKYYNFIKKDHYSFKRDSTNCVKCPDEFQCKGGMDIWLLEGNWRKNIYSIYTVECVNKIENCIGGK